MRGLGKTVVRLVLCIMLMAAVLTGCGSTSEKKEETKEGTDKQESSLEVEIAMVCSGAGKNDNGYNQRAVEAAKQFGNDKKTGVKVVETSDSLSVPDALKQLADGGAKLIFSLEYDFDALISGVGGEEPIASQYPDTTFVIFNAKPNVDEVGNTIHNNVITVLFDVHEGSFLAGYLAVYTNENLSKLFDTEKYAFNLDSATNRKTGYIGANTAEGILVFLYGYMEGASYACGELGIEYEFVGKHDAGLVDATAGSSFSDSFYALGGNIIYGVAGNVGTGVTSRAADLKRLAIEVDANKDNTRPGNILTSVLKNTDVPVKDICEAYAAGNLNEMEDIQTYSVASGGAGITDLSVISEYIKEDGQETWEMIQNNLEGIKEKMTSKEIVVTNGQAGEKLNPEKVSNLKYSDAEAAFAK